MLQNRMSRLDDLPQKFWNSESPRISGSSREKPSIIRRLGERSTDPDTQPYPTFRSIKRRMIILKPDATVSFELSLNHCQSSLRKHRPPNSATARTSQNLRSRSPLRRWHRQVSCHLRPSLVELPANILIHFEAAIHTDNAVLD